MHKKDISYHSSAVKYNEGLAEVAERLAEEVENDEVKKWCKSVGKQHRFHAKRHSAALAKLEKSEKDDKPLVGDALLDKQDEELAEHANLPDDPALPTEAGAEEKHEVNA